MHETERHGGDLRWELDEDGDVALRFEPDFLSLSLYLSPADLRAMAQALDEFEREQLDRVAEPSLVSYHVDDDALEHISLRYGVPARIGARVIYTEPARRRPTSRLGRICGTYPGGHLAIQLDGDDFAMPHHPKEGITYIERELEEVGD